MERDVNKVLSEYRSLTESKKGTFGGFYSSDIIMLWDNYDIKNPRSCLYEITADALNFGFMIGYKAGKRARRTKKAKR